jgi:hypothetical protein
MPGAPGATGALEDLAVAGAVFLVVAVPGIAFVADPATREAALALWRRVRRQ